MLKKPEENWTENKVKVKSYMPSYKFSRLVLNGLTFCSALALKNFVF